MKRKKNDVIRSELFWHIIPVSISDFKFLTIPKQPQKIEYFKLGCFSQMQHDCEISPYLNKRFMINPIQYLANEKNYNRVLSTVMYRLSARSSQ
jgi:hypothetical protein